MDFLEIFNDGDDGAAELGGDDHRLDVAIVLESVAHDQAVRRILGERHDREQLGFRAHLKAEAEFLAVAIDFLDHQALLIDLDREHRRVTIAVFVLGDGAAEGVRQMTQTVCEDVGEADDHRRVQIARLESLHDFIEIDLA